MTYSAKMRDVEQLNQRIETTTRIESLQLADVRLWKIEPEMWKWAHFWLYFW